MNHFPSGELTDARPLTRRAMAKLKTRQTLLAAARQLFGERGYEAATIRDIAAVAGMSTGAVFANFADKAELFSEILAADDEQMLAQMQRASQSQQGVKATLMAALGAAYEFHLQQLPLFQAARAAAWSLPGTVHAAASANSAQIRVLLEQALRRGMVDGELQADLDSPLAADLIWQAYLSNYRLAIYDKAGKDVLTCRMARQLDLVLQSSAA